MFDQINQAFQLISKGKEVEGAEHFSFYCRRTLIGHCEKVKAIVITSHSAVLFVMFNTVTLYQPKSTSKKWWFISSSVIQRSGDVRERTLGNRLSSLPLK